MNKILVFIIILSSLFFVIFLVYEEENSPLSYRYFACSFEEKPLNCLDENSEWNAGLFHFDSMLSVSNDTLFALKDLLWNFWKIEFAGAGAPSFSQEATLPLRVLENKKSGCMGLSWLALMVAEARHIPLNAVLLPGHVFLKYKNENLEPNRAGYSYSDDEYKEKYANKKWTGLEFKPLKIKEFIGLSAFNIGNFYLEKSPQEALIWYRIAEDLFPEYPGISINQKIAKTKI